MKNTRFNCLFLLLSIGVSFNLFAQGKVGSWKIHLAYQNATMVAETPNLCFGVYDGSLLSYSPEDDEIITYSFEDGMNDVDIQGMVYSPDETALVLAYKNGNIDLFFGRNNVYNLPFLKDNIYIQDKTVYNLELIGDYAYLSTAFGIVVIDIKRKEIKDSYRLGVKVFSITQKGDSFYALTEEGVKQASVSSNLLDKENWKTMQLAYPGYYWAGKKIFFFQDQMIIGQSDAVFYRGFNGDFELLRYGPVRSVDLVNDRIVLNANDRTLFYSSLSQYTQIMEPAYQTIPAKGNNSYWMAGGKKGIIRIEKNPESEEYKTTVEGITVNSPKRNLNFYMTCHNDKLYIVGGGRDADRNNSPGTLMILDLKTNQWFNLDEEAVAAATGLDCKDFMSVAVDPRDPGHYFVSSWGEGVYEFKENKFVKLYSYTNSTLETAVPDWEPQSFVRIDGLVYDRNNNLWMVNGSVQNGLQMMSADGDWDSFYYPGLAYKQVNRILISSNNTMWFNFWRRPVGMAAIKGENQYFSESFVDQQGRNVDVAGYLCMAEDKSGTIWVGTDNGPISFSSPEMIRDGRCYRVVAEDEYGAGYYLMENQEVTAIAVDGGNRKWMGTSGGGIYVVNQTEGLEVINYTKENSPLISNKITSLTINDATGEVFVGTDIGLCSYMSEAVEGKPDYSEVYAYPNPVHPSRNNQVVITGLIQNSTVKITDLTGNLIKEGRSMGGQYLWNCTDRTGSTVKAGIYLVFASTSTGSEGVVTKIMVIQ